MAKRKTEDDYCDTSEQTSSGAGETMTAEDGGEQSSARAPKTVITPVSKRIGESGNNLQRREDWYQRRTRGGA